jgi:hypothetical protein
MGGLVFDNDGNQSISRIYQGRTLGFTLNLNVTPKDPTAATEIGTKKKSEIHTRGRSMTKFQNEGLLFHPLDRSVYTCGFIRILSATLTLSLLVAEAFSSFLPVSLVLPQIADAATFLQCCPYEAHHGDDDDDDMDGDAVAPFGSWWVLVGRR